MPTRVAEVFIKCKLLLVNLKPKAIAGAYNLVASKDQATELPIAHNMPHAVTLSLRKNATKKPRGKRGFVRVGRYE